MYGESDFSEELNAGVSSFPAKPNPVRKLLSESTQTAITLEWDTSLATSLPVIGYRLLMKDATQVNYQVVFDGANFPNVRKYLVTGLKTGDLYTFIL